jgi:hypothetical protein
MNSLQQNQGHSYIYHRNRGANTHITREAPCCCLWPLQSIQQRRTASHTLPFGTAAMVAAALPPLVLLVLLLSALPAGVLGCRKLHQPCYEPGTAANHSSCCTGSEGNLVCDGPLHAPASRCVQGSAPPAPPPPGVCGKEGDSCTVKGSGGGINPAEFSSNWVSTCCDGLLCRLGAKPGLWNCSTSRPHPAGPSDAVAVHQPSRLTPSLTVVSRSTVRGTGGAYKPWLVQLHSPGSASTPAGELLLAYRAMPSKQLTFQRSLDFGASWTQPEIRTDIKDSGGEWSLHVLQADGTVLLTDGSGRMFRSTDSARSFSNVTGVPGSAGSAAQPWKFNCTDECGSWSVVEVSAADEQLQRSAGALLPAGVYFFVDRWMWQSLDSGRTWRPFSRASSPSGHMPRDGEWGHDEFFSQSQVYRRRDGTFLHSVRVNSAPCDSWAGEQLWKSNDTLAQHWHCLTQADGGFCGSTNTGHSPTGCYHQADEPMQCTATDHHPNWLKPGNHYSRWLRLRDDRLLLTWTHRSNTIDDDGYGTGSRGLLSYDDGATFDLSKDYIVMFSQSDNFCNPPVPYKGGEILLCCAPAKGGCACNVGESGSAYSVPPISQGRA